MKILIAAFLLLTACSTAPLHPKARKVELWTGTALDKESYEPLGEISCYRSSHFRAWNTEENCQITLRNVAAKLGAEIVVVEREDNLCKTREESACSTLYASLYKKKTVFMPEATAAEAAPSASLLDFPLPNL